MTTRVVITGGASGIGKELALGFLKEGYEVFVLDCIVSNFDNDLIHSYQVDLCEETQIQSCFKEIYEQFGEIHILINNGAISKYHQSIEKQTIEEFDRVLNTNLRGTYICCKEFIHYHQKGNFGRIINIASTRFHQNEAGWEAYGASKGAIVSLTNSLCVSLSNTGITVNAISPGWIQVEDYEQLSQEDHNWHPSGRVGKAKDILNACLFLSQKENDFINGSNLIIDGGVTKKMIYC